MTKVKKYGVFFVEWGMGDEIWCEVVNVASER